MTTTTISSAGSGQKGMLLIITITMVTVVQVTIVETITIMIGTSMRICLGRWINIWRGIIWGGMISLGLMGLIDWAWGVVGT